MRFNVIAKVLGSALKYFAIILFLPIIFALFYNELQYVRPFLLCPVVSLLLGYLIAQGGSLESINDLKKSEALCCVFFSWVLFGLICTIPYLCFGIAPIDSLFEAYSGITTTGATILTDFSIYPKTFFFFRSMTQWLGGMGIILLFIAILPKFAVAGRQMFFAELPTAFEEKITPRIHKTALWLWTIYLVLTLAEIIALHFIAKIDMYHAICLSFSTLSSGGFMSDPSSIAYFNSSKVVWIVLLFMFLAGCNFVLQYRVFIQRKFKIIFKNEEFLTYFCIITIFALSIAYVLHNTQGIDILTSLRESFFVVVSAITTTGFISFDFPTWDIDARILIFSAMFIGGCAASTSGGIKVARWIFVFKYLKRELVKIIHPSAIHPIKIDGVVIEKDVRRQMLSFVIFYIVIFVVSSFLVSMIEKDVTLAAFGSLTTLGNIGLTTTSMENIKSITKVIFIFNMLIGRLELIPFLALLHPDAWRGR